MDKQETKRKIAILMSIREEEVYIDFNIQYHLDLGFDYIFVANHSSTDGTNKILGSYKNDPRVIITEETDPVFDHAKIANKLLALAKSSYEIDWFIFLDADEFLSIKDGSIHAFVNRLEKEKIPYATIGWANALFDYTFSDYRCSPVNPIDTTKYYYPWPERDWQEYGHFRKAIVKNHDNMEIVVGGHYVKTENNRDFFGEYHWNPFIVPKDEAMLLHFEFRGKAEDIYKKWQKLASFESDSTSPPDAPWLERIQTIKRYVEEFKGNIEGINKRWFSEHRTFWGTLIPENGVVYDTTLLIWYRKYFRRKLESGKIKSVCLVRSGHLGDVIMTEPIARFLKKYTDRVCLATDIKEIGLLINTYDQIYSYSQIPSGNAKSDMFVRLIYELSDNKKTYIQGYMESVGFGNTTIKDIPKLNSRWKRIINDNYIMIAPFTSSWEEKKRGWDYKKFIALSKLLEREYGTKCVVLEKRYSFEDMLSLVKNCQFLVGSDSAPAIIAQSFGKKSCVIFGATRPEYLHLSKYAVSIYDRNRHKLCQHNSRQEEIDCCEEFCMERIRVSDVFNQIKSNI